MDNYIDRFIGVEGETRRIKRNLNENTGMIGIGDFEHVMELLKMAMKMYGPKKEADNKDKVGYFIN